VAALADTLFWSNISRDFVRLRCPGHSYGNHPGHLFNLAHGITPEVDPVHAKVLMDEAHVYGRIPYGN
jgi:hypothetical protein